MNKWRYHKYVGTPLGALFTTSDEEKILKFLQKHVQEKGTTPSVRRLCREANISPSKFYALFGSLESLCEKAGVKLDQGTISRISISAKATRKHVRKAERKRSRVQTPAPTVEGENCEPQQTPTFALIQEDLATEQEARESRRERTQQFAGEIKTLALNDDPEIGGPIVDALCFEVLPTVLEREFGVSFTLEELCQAELTLREVEKERKKLRKQQVQLDGERLEIQREWETLKRDSDKASLLEHVERLKREQKINVGRFNEAYYAFKQFRMLFREIMPIMRRCPTCYKTVIQNMMESHDDILEWITSGKYTRLSFETEDKPRLGYRT